MASKRTRKIRKAPVDPVIKLAMTLLPGEQVRAGLYAIRDVANHSEADQRAMVRSGEKRTIRRKTRVELMRDAGVINADQALACEWYATAFETGFQTVGCTANYEGAGGGGFGSSDLLARYKAQAEARENYHYARLSIPRQLTGIFDEVVLGTGRPPHMMRREDRLRFSLAAFLLHGQIGHMLAIAA
jgi:hypothetical protein